MDYITYSVNENPIIAREAGADLGLVRGRAIAFDQAGKVTLAETGGIAIGVGVVSNLEPVLEGDDVFIQVAAIGLVKVGAAVQAGAFLAPATGGMLVPASAGDAYIAVALQAAAANSLVQAIVRMGTVPAAVSEPIPAPDADPISDSDPASTT